MFGLGATELLILLVLGGIIVGVVVLVVTLARPRPGQFQQQMAPPPAQALCRNCRTALGAGQFCPSCGTDRLAAS